MGLLEGKVILVTGAGNGGKPSAGSIDAAVERWILIGNRKQRAGVDTGFPSGGNSYLLAR